MCLIMPLAGHIYDDDACKSFASWSKLGSPFPLISAVYSGTAATITDLPARTIRANVNIVLRVFSSSGTLVGYHLHSHGTSCHFTLTSFRSVAQTSAARTMRKAPV